MHAIVSSRDEHAFRPFQGAVRSFRPNQLTYLPFCGGEHHLDIPAHAMASIDLPIFLTQDIHFHHGLGRRRGMTVAFGAGFLPHPDDLFDTLPAR